MSLNFISAGRVGGKADKASWKLLKKKLNRLKCPLLTKKFPFPKS